MNQPPLSRIKAARRALATSLLLGVVGALGGFGWPTERLPKRFGTVVEGRLYRSGEISPRQLEMIVQNYGVRRVISLLDPSVAESVAEREAAERLGIEWVNIPMRGNGASTPQQRDELRKALFGPHAPPTLVHCAAGVNRTGLAVGMFRLHEQGWTLEETLEELRRNDFEDEPKHENLRAALREQAGMEASAQSP